jgi:hypothetical protein
MKLFPNGQLVKIVNTSASLDGTLCVVVGISLPDWKYPVYFIKKQNGEPWLNGYSVMELTAACLTDDGKIFETQAECEKYETKTDSSDEWILNTQTLPLAPSTLSEEDIIEVVLSNGHIHKAQSLAWDASWNVNDKYRHIVKYRKVANCQL